MIINENAQQILESRYLWIGNGETCWDDICKRLSFIIGNNTNNPEFFIQRFYEILEKGLFIPGGRIIRNTGRPRGSMFNCYCVPFGDSIEEIMDGISACGKLWKDGGGTGITLSNLRPATAKLQSSGGESSGPVSFLYAADAVANTIQTGGQRRAAGLALLDVSHPDIFEFINTKQQDKTLQHFNLSVGITEDFIDSVIQDREWPLMWQRKVWKSVDARKLWKLIIDGLSFNGEPGLINLDNLTKNNSYYFAPITGTNPCLAGDSLLLDGDYLQRISIKTSKCNKWNSWLSGYKDAIKIKFNNGSHITCTPDHKLMLEDGSFKKAKDCAESNLAWGLGNRSASIIYNYNVLQGFLFGDGFICGDGCGVSVKLNTNKEPECAELLLHNNFHLQKSGAFYINKDELCVDVQFLNKHVYERDLPDSILYGHSNVVAGFLRGLFAANGSCNKAGQISLKATCKSMVEKVQILLQSFGVPCWISINKPTVVEWNNGSYLSRESYNLQIAPTNAELFQHKIGFIAKSKYNNIKPGGEYKTKLRIKSIKYIGAIPVYDFNMKTGNHWNFCNGIVVHNCGETCLENWGVCNLGSLVLKNFVVNGRVKWKLLEDTIHLTIKFLDTCIDVNNYTLPQIRQTAERGRRVGLGVMGLADMLFEIGLKYGSNDALDFVERLFKFIRNVSYEASIKIASELGAFPAFDSNLYCHAKFIKTLPVSIRQSIRKYGTRNVTLLAMAPTGTISLIPECTSGIEPLTYKAYKRQDRVSTRYYIHPKYKEAIENNDSVPDYICDSTDLVPMDHLEVQATVQKYVDGAVSKTINISSDFDTSDLSDLLLESIHDLKGVTVYRDGSREGQPLVPITDKEAIKIIKQNKHIEHANSETVLCARGTCEI